MTAFNILIPLALAAVLAVLVLGLRNLKNGGSPSRSQNLMRLRILLQAVAVVLVVAALYFGGRG